MLVIKIFRRLQLILSTRSFRKENLILVSAFGTNSKILVGLIDFLGDFFNVYFIDLPGFISSKPKMNKISNESYISYINFKIKELKLNDYILGGVSYGFLLVNSLNENPKCKGYLAIEPYVGIKTLRWSKTELKMLRTFASGIESLNVAQIVWQSKLFRLLLKLFSHLSFKTIDQIIVEEDPDAFFETAKQVFSLEGTIKLHNKPHILVINTKDNTLNSDIVIGFFQSNSKNLYTIYTKIEHYPLMISRKYIEKRIRRGDIYTMLRWLNKKK